MNSSWNSWSLEDFQKQWELTEASLKEEESILDEMAGLETNAKKRKSINRDHVSAHQMLMADYFNETCTYTAAQFRRRFRMKRPLFLRIVESLSAYDNYFTQRRNHARKLGLTPIQMCTTAMRMLAYGNATDACDEYIKIGVTTALECTRNFCDGIISLFENEYLRRPNEADLQRLLQVGEDRGFPGTIGSIDCMHRSWRNCPKAWHGQFTNGHKGTTTAILEVVASYDLWIWHAFFGLAGVLNDINVLQRPHVFDDLESGVAPKVNYVVNGNQYNMTYYLADGIYPKWLVFIQSIVVPHGDKAKLFANKQESCRKDVEHAFGVLQARFAILRQPAKIWNLEVLGKIMKACIILHNMIVDDERDSYSRNWENLQENVDFEPSANAGPSSSFNVQTEMHPTLQMHVQGRTRASIRYRGQHIQLKNDLVEHIWNKFGTTED